MKSTTITNTAIRINGLQIQSSAYGRCIPLLYGTKRLSANLFFYDDFVATPHTTTTESSGGKGGGGVSQSSTSYTYTSSIMFGLSEGQINGIGSVWSDKSKTTLTDVGLSLFDGNYSQSVWGHLTANHPTKALNYRGQSFLASPTFSLGDNAQLPNLNFEVKGLKLFNTTDSNPKEIVTDFLTNDKYGVGFPVSKIGDLTDFNNYCLSNGILLSPMFDEQKAGAEHLVDLLRSCNSSFVWSEGKLKIIPYGDSTSTGNGVTYTPNLTPIYDLTDDDFIDFDEPIRISRSANADAYNHIKVEFINRSNDYNAEIAEVKDLANIDLYGLRPSDTIQMHSICDATTAKNVAQLMLQRMLYVRNSYEFKVSWKYCLLEPMDLITLTDSTLGLDKLVVRISEIQEDEEGILSIKAEEFPFGVASATLYPSQNNQGTAINYYIAPGNVNTPIVFEPPLLLSNNYEIWTGLSGGASWGGADVWVSYDGSSYSFLDTVTQPSRTGILTSAWTSGNTVSVDLSQCNGNLISSTEVLALVGNEIIKYSIATLTGTNKYNLTVVQRGLYNTKIVNHAISERFLRLDSAILKQQFTTDMIGKTIYYKALSFNIYGSAKQALADVSPFTFLVEGDLYPPATVTGFDYTSIQTGIELKWNPNTEIDVKNYEIRETDSGWGDSNYVWRGFANKVTIVQKTANKTYYIKAIDSLGNYSTTSTNKTVIPIAPTVPTNLTSVFSVTSSSMAIVEIDWNESSSVFGIDYYLIEYASKSVKINTTIFQTPADWIGNQNFTITAIDKMGFASTPAVISVTKLIPVAPNGFRSQVIDNNVLFYWEEPTATSLPITSYELRRGNTWDNATVIGKKAGGFTTVFESVGGYYTYWIASIDADNRYSTAVSVATTVSQPPDFILKASFDSTFIGTKSNAIIDVDGSLLLMADTSKTWTTHFTSMSWTTPQAQIDAGYPYFIQPTVTPSFYEETVDLGTVIDSSRVTVNQAGNTITGAVVTTFDISLSLDGISWTTHNGSWQVYGTNFRYYKFRITATSTDNKGAYKITSINCVLDSKLKNDAGMVNALSTDANGTIFNFNIPFVDITSIVCTPQGTTPLTPVYDFKDSVINGTYSVASNIATINCTAHELIAGQNVKLSFTSGTAPNGIYSVASIINANSYTISIITSNTSGNVSSYAESARVYLFTSAGARASGTVSWNAKGY